MSQKTTTRRLLVAVGCMATLELQCYNCSSELELLEAFVRELACRIIVRVKMTVLFTICLFALQNLKKQLAKFGVDTCLLTCVAL